MKSQLFFDRFKEITDLMVCIFHYLTKVCLVNLYNGSASIKRLYESRALCQCVFIGRTYAYNFCPVTHTRILVFQLQSLCII